MPGFDDRRRPRDSIPVSNESTGFDGTGGLPAASSATNGDEGERASKAPPGAEERNEQRVDQRLVDLEATARAAVARLAEHPDPEAFQALLRLSAVVGESLGISARTLAASGSWAKVAEVAGTSRQAAWSRWSG